MVILSLFKSSSRTKSVLLMMMMSAKATCLNSQRTYVKEKLENFIIKNYDDLTYHL